MGIVILEALGIAIGINLIFFIIAFMIKQDLFTDITYASTFLIVTLVFMLIYQTFAIQQILALILIIIWSMRLGSFLLIRIWKTKIDRRFNNMRNHFFKFGAFWMLQALTVWIVNTPLYFIMSGDYNHFNSWSIVPFGLAIIFVTFEGVADLQKYFFNKKHHGQFIASGLWKISRHPNYFGEYMFWLMVVTYLLINRFTFYYLSAFISPLYIMTSLYLISGVNLLEKRDYRRFATDRNYWQYINRTACVVPLFGKKGPIKRWLPPDVKSHTSTAHRN